MGFWGFSIPLPKLPHLRKLKDITKHNFQGRETTTTTTTTTAPETTSVGSTTFPVWKSQPNRWGDFGGIRGLDTTEKTTTTIESSTDILTTTAPTTVVTMQMTEILTTTKKITQITKPKKESYTSVGEGLCSSRSFSIRSTTIFTGRSYNLVNPAVARSSFSAVASQISHLGKTSHTCMHSNL